MQNFKIVVDRIEYDIAVLLVRDEEGSNETTRIDMPLFLLPPETIEGDILDVTITRDAQETKDTRERISILLDKLKNKNQETE